MPYVFLNIKNIGWGMKLAALISGGKDSIYALKRVSEDHDVNYLICVKAEADSKFLHSENLDLVKLQSEALGIPLVWREGSGEGMAPLEDAIETVSDKVDGIVSGAIASNYQRERVETICDRFDLESLVPLWGMDEHELMENLIRESFDIVVVKVAAQGLGDEWLGRKIDGKALKDLKDLETQYSIHVAGEGGEFETVVVDCPIFSRKINIKKVDKKWEANTGTGYMSIISAGLVDK